MNRLWLILMGVLLSSVAGAASLEYVWEEVDTRVDGSPTTGAVVYYLRYSVNNVEEIVVTSEPFYTLTDIEAGSYVAQVATAEEGKRGAWTETVTTVVGDVEAAAPNTTVLTVTFSCNDCDLEVK